MENAIAIRKNNTAIEIPKDYIPVAGIENLSPDDFSLPALKLIQVNTDLENADQFAGKWYRRDTGEIIESPRVLIIGIAKNRVLFPSEYSGDGKTLCRSDNGAEPRADSIGGAVFYMLTPNTGKAIVTEANADEGDPHNMTIPETCAECPLSQWGKEGAKPPCRLSDNWAALTEDGDPVLIRFGGSAAKISAKLRNLARAATAKRRPLYVELSSHFEKGEIGNYYVPDVLSIRDTPPEDLIETAKAFIGLNMAARAIDMMSDEELSKQDEGHIVEQATTRTVDLNADMPADALENEYPEYPF